MRLVIRNGNFALNKLFQIQIGDLEPDIPDPDDPVIPEPDDPTVEPMAQWGQYSCIYSPSRWKNIDFTDSTEMNIAIGLKIDEEQELPFGMNYYDSELEGFVLYNQLTFTWESDELETVNLQNFVNLVLNQYCIDFYDHGYVVPDSTDTGAVKFVLQFDSIDSYNVHSTGVSMVCKCKIVDQAKEVWEPYWGIDNYEGTVWAVEGSLPNEEYEFIEGSVADGEVLMYDTENDQYYFFILEQIIQTIEWSQYEYITDKDRYKDKYLIITDGDYGMPLQENNNIYTPAQLVVNSYTGGNGGPINPSGNPISCVIEYNDDGVITNFTSFSNAFQNKYIVEEFLTSGPFQDSIGTIAAKIETSSGTVSDGNMFGYFIGVIEAAEAAPYRGNYIKTVTALENEFPNMDYTLISGSIESGEVYMKDEVSGKSYYYVNHFTSDNTPSTVVTWKKYNYTPATPGYNEKSESIGETYSKTIYDVGENGYDWMTFAPGIYSSWYYDENLNITSNDISLWHNVTSSTTASDLTNTFKNKYLIISNRAVQITEVSNLHFDTSGGIPHVYADFTGIVVGKVTYVVGTPAQVGTYISSITASEGALPENYTVIQGTADSNTLVMYDSTASKYYYYEKATSSVANVFSSICHLVYSDTNCKILYSENHKDFIIVDETGTFTQYSINISDGDPDHNYETFDEELLGGRIHLIGYSGESGKEVNISGSYVNNQGSKNFDITFIIP